MWNGALQRDARGLASLPLENEAENFGSFSQGSAPGKGSAHNPGLRDGTRIGVRGRCTSLGSNSILSTWRIGILRESGRSSYWTKMSLVRDKFILVSPSP